MIVILNILYMSYNNILVFYDFRVEIGWFESKQIKWYILHFFTFDKIYKIDPMFVEIISSVGWKERIMIKFWFLDKIVVNFELVEK